jgi:hypothetical protein
VNDSPLDAFNVFDALTAGTAVGEVKKFEQPGRNRTKQHERRQQRQSFVIISGGSAVR